MIFITLFHYLCPLDSALDPQGSLSQAVLRLVMEEVNREVNKAEAQQKKNGASTSHSGMQHQQSLCFADVVASHARLDTEALHLFSCLV